MNSSNEEPVPIEKHVDFCYDPKLSLLGRTAIKLKPILEEVLSRLLPEDQSDFVPLIPESEFSTKFDKVDMRNLLGYLNQSDWIWSLNIGNIMQVSPLTLQDVYSTTTLEYELSRELILEKICFLAVSYFCVSTELRFLCQLNQVDEKG